MNAQPMQLIKQNGLQQMSGAKIERLNLKLSQKEN